MINIVSSVQKVPMKSKLLSKKLTLNIAASPVQTSEKVGVGPELEKNGSATL